MSQNHPLVSIISVNYNQLAITCEMLASVSQLGYPNLEVIVVDNHSQTDPGAYLKSHFPWVKYIRSNENLGFAGGNNLGIKAAKGEYLFFLNNDTELLPCSLYPLLELFEKQSKAGIVCPMICYYPDEEQKSSKLIQYLGATPVHPLTGRNKILGEGEYDRGQYQKARTTAYAHGAAMLVSRKLIDRVGPMPEDFFLYYEELDWCEQARSAGFEIWVEPKAKIYHKESVSVGKWSPLKTYYLNRNRILFMRRNTSSFQFLLFSIFLFTFTVPKNVFVFLLRGEWVQLRSFLKAVIWNYGKRNKNHRREIISSLISENYST